MVGSDIDEVIGVVLHIIWNIILLCASGQGEMCSD